MQRKSQVLTKLSFCVAAALLMPWAAASALDYPTKAVTIIVPFPAGAGPDVVARLVAERLATRLGQPFVVENRPGASGLVGATAVARAAPDGHTLLVTPNTLFIAPHVMPSGTKPPIDVVADLTPVVALSQTTMVLVANPALGVKDAKQLADLARKEPGKITYASSGNGSVLQIAGELFNQAAQVNIQHVPYRGIAPAITDVLAGHVKITFSGYGPVRDHIQSGTLIALAVVEAKRSTVIPNLSTAIEQGFADVAVDGWYAMLAPKGLPTEIVDRLNKEVNATIALPDVRERIEKLGDLPLGGSQEVAAARVKHDYDRYGQIVSRLKITSD